MSTSTHESATDVRAQAVRGLESEFGELINRVRRLMADNADRMSPGMLPGAYKTFTTIMRRESITLSALAETLMADRGQVSRMVRELEQLGFIERTPDPADGRSSLLSPTVLGLERLAVARAPQEDGLLATLDAWSIDEIHQLTRLLHALTEGSASPLTRKSLAPQPILPNQVGKNGSGVGIAHRS